MVLNRDYLAAVIDAGGDGFSVEGLDGVHIQHAGVHALGGEGLCGGEGETNGVAVGDYGGV